MFKLVASEVNKMIHRGAGRNQEPIMFLKVKKRGAWVAQSLERPTSAQVRISRSVSSSPASGSGLTAQSLETVSDFVSPSLSAPPLFMSLSVSKINKNI